MKGKGKYLKVSGVGQGEEKGKGDFRGVKVEEEGKGTMRGIQG